MKSFYLFFIFLLFSLSICGQDIYFQEDFENGYPSGWENDGAWAWGDMETLSSGQFPIEGNTTNFMAFNDNKQGSMNLIDGALVTESIDLNNVEGTIWLEINTFFPNRDFAGANETFEILFSLDNGQTWESIQEYEDQPWFTNAYRLDILAGNFIKLAFRYHDGDAQNFGVAIDDIVISNGFVNATQKDYSLTVNGGSLFNQALAGTAYQIDGLVFNYGFETIQSFDINITKEGTTDTYTLDGFNIAPLGVARYVMPEKITIPSYYLEMTVSISNVNGTQSEDIDVSDNSAIIQFEPVDINPDKVVVLEDATGAWCSWCIRGTIYMDELAKRFGNHFAGLAVHSGDPMENEEHNDKLIEFPGFSGWPAIIVDRKQLTSPNNALVNSIVQSLQEAPAARLELGGELINNVLTTSLKINFLQDVDDADYRILIVLSEDDIIGNGSNSYLQKNAFADGSAGPMAGMEYLTSDVSPELLPYNHVSRLLIGSYDGTGDIIQGGFAPGDVINHIFNEVSLNPEWDVSHLKLAGILLDDNGKVINGVVTPMDNILANGLTSSPTLTQATEQISIYPNPLINQNLINIDLGEFHSASYSLSNSHGKIIIKNQTIKNSSTRIDMSTFPRGVYYISLFYNGQIFTRNIIKL